MKRSLLHFTRLLRYRFFVFGGVFPYILGAAAAYQASFFNPAFFLLGFFGIALACGGVEFLNVYFEPEDTLFPEEELSSSTYKFWAGISCFVLSLSIAIFLTLKTGILALVLAILGFLIAYFYVGPPVRLIYRGLGEIGIFLAYGPLMVLGSYYIQSLEVDFNPVFLSLIPGALIFSLAILNEIPDYYWDMLMGKRNIVVRIGREKGTILYWASFLFAYIALIIGVIVRILPWPSLFAFLSIPLILKAGLWVRRYYDEPVKFLPAVNNTLFSYLAVNIIIIISLFLS